MGAYGGGASLIIKLTRLCGLMVLCLLVLTGCQGGAEFDPENTTGRIAGELNITGPISRNLDLSIGVTRVGRDDSVEQAALGRLVSSVTARLDGRSVAFDFTQLAIGTYNIVLYGAGVGPENIYYRSDKVRLTAEVPEAIDLSQEISLTGPPPWGTISGTLMLSGVRPPSTEMLLYVTNADADSFRYEFNMWDADFGVMYFVIGGLAFGEYTLGLSDPMDFQMLGYLADPVAINKVQSNPNGAVLWGEFPEPQSDDTRYSVSGKVVLSAAPPATAQLALIAVKQGSPDLGTSPIYHLRPDHIEAGLQSGFFLNALEAGDYDLQVYALDFINGNHQVIGGLAGPLVLAGDSRFFNNIQVPADISLIPAL